MTESAVRGNFYLRSATLDSDVEFLRARVAALDEPKAVKTLDAGEIRFWQVGFAASSTQWHALAPMLEGRAIKATVLEEAHLAPIARIQEERKLATISRHSRLGFLHVLGVLILFVGVASFSFLRDSRASCAILALGLVTLAVAATWRSMSDEKAGE